MTNFWRIMKPPYKPTTVKTNSVLITSDPKVVLESLSNEFKTFRQPTNQNYVAMLDSLRSVIVTQPEW